MTASHPTEPIMSLIAESAEFGTRLRRSSALPTDVKSLKSSEKRKFIFQLWRDGYPESELADHFGCRAATVRRSLNRERSQRLAAIKLEYIDSEEFHKPDADRSILSEPPQPRCDRARNMAPHTMPEYIRALYSYRLLSADEEQYWFRRMNYLRFKADELRKTIVPTRPRKLGLDNIDEYLTEATEIRNFLVRHNLRLVAAIARKGGPHGENELFERISEGNAALLRSVERFDYTRGFKLSTYATWAIKKSLAGRWKKMTIRNGRFPTVSSDMFDSCEAKGMLPAQFEKTLAMRKQQLASVMELLERRDQTVLNLRFGLRNKGDGATLHDVGKQIGVSKERVRQIEQRAMQRLRYLIKSREPDLLEILSA